MSLDSQKPVISINPILKAAVAFSNIYRRLNILFLYNDIWKRSKLKDHFEGYLNSVRLIFN